MADRTVTRFWAKVERSETGCWLWQAKKTPDGYGRFHYGRQVGYAHRFVYELLVGPIPEGLTIDHLCRVRSCVRPDHLEAVTFLENVRRGRQGEHERRKTHCPHGHPYDETNTYRPPRGGRQCRTCMAKARRAWECRKKTAHG